MSRGPLLIVRAEQMVVVDLDVTPEELDDHLGRAAHYLRTGEAGGIAVIDVAAPGTPTAPITGLPPA